MKPALTKASPPECPCDREKSIDPHCAAAGQCEQQFECECCGEMVDELHDVSELAGWDGATACSECASQMEQDQIHEEQTYRDYRYR